MSTVRDVSSAEATRFLCTQDRLPVFITGTVGFYIMVGALQAALATAPGPRKRSTVESVREVSSVEAVKFLRKHDKLKVIKAGVGLLTAVFILQAALAYTSASRKSAKLPKTDASTS